MSTKLTDELLNDLGFRGEGRGLTNNPAYRLEVPPFKERYYSYEIQLVLNPYPDTNPNSGILSLYAKGTKDVHCITSEKDKGQKESKKIDHILERDGKTVVGIKYINIPDRCFPIAWHVTTLERLNSIYTALTGNPPLEPRKKS